MTRIVIDTNVVASAVFLGGRSEELLRKVLARNVVAVITEEIADEYQQTIDAASKEQNFKQTGEIDESKCKDGADDKIVSAPVFYAQKDHF